MAAASRRHNCNGRRRWQHKGRRDGNKIAMDNGNGDGNCGLRQALGGAVAEGSSKGNS